MRRDTRAATTVDPQIAKRFVLENWPVLAATAWRLHLRHGLGALIVEWPAVEAWCRDPSQTFATHYTTQTNDKAFNKRIADHDPTTAVVIAFADCPIDSAPSGPAPAGTSLAVLRGTSLAALTIVAEPPPPAAPRARGH